MNRDIPYKWKRRILLTLALALAAILGGVAVLPVQSFPADDPPCGVGGVVCPLVGDFDLLSVEPAAAGGWSVNGPAAPAFGALVYDPDFKLLEQEARTRLQRGMEMRLALSPYRESQEFEDYVKAFDYAIGWSRAYTGTNPYGGTPTLIGLINRVDQDLTEARDMYAYLAVHAPGERFRTDSYYTGAPPAGFDQALCGATDQENPDPVDPAHSGLVLDPVIDWCNFPARLRQSVREAANMRLLFGQQFMVDAMGLHFSGVEFVGGENAVRKELAQLDAAKNQYVEAEKRLEESLSRVVGNGCLVSDFYTQSEWSLLSRVIANQETAQHEIAIRKSYMDIANQDSVPKAQAAAKMSFRQASIDGYLKLIGMASLASGQPGVGCALGERPDGPLVAELASNLIETRRKVQELDDHRNVLGFDVSFTPARPYKSSSSTTCDQSGEGDRGLWDEAMCAAEYAKELQNDEVANTRAFDLTQQDLRTEAENIRTILDTRIATKSGANRTNFPNDQAWYAGIKRQVELLYGCQLLVDEFGVTAKLDYIMVDGRLAPYDSFERCMENPDILNSEAKRALYDLRAIYYKYKLIEEKSANITKRIELSEGRSAIVKEWLGSTGTAETVARASNALQQMVGCFKPSSPTSIGVIPINIGCGLAGATNITAQIIAGAVSTNAKIAIENADQYKEEQNLLLNQSELVIEAYSAKQQFLSKAAEYSALLNSLARIKVSEDGQLTLEAGSLLLEAQRARAYFLKSPANDPSYRMVRDSSRMVLAKQMEYATRMAYLAARRAEYEYAARLSASNFRISDIYRARTADDIKRYLQGLLGVTNNLAGSATYQTNADDFSISVAQHVLLLTDEALAKEGFSDPAAAQAERVRRFRLWVAENTLNDPAISSKPVLRFSITTSLLESGLFSNVVQEGYDRYWLLKLSGITEPKASNNGISLNLVSDQSGLSYRTVSLTQGGLVHLSSFAGCTFDYRLMSPAMLLGQEWASNQSPEAATAVWKANVNTAHAYIENGFRTPTFLGRAASSTDWEVLLYSGAPAAGMPDMDLQQLTDIELNFSTTYASRQPGTPQLSECTRIDW